VTLTDEDLRAAAALANRARFPEMGGAHDRAAAELAREYVPRLLAEVRRLRAEVAQTYRELAQALERERDARDGESIARGEAAALRHERDAAYEGGRRHAREEAQAEACAVADAMLARERAEIRAKALEEAARVAEGWGGAGLWSTHVLRTSIAADIRALARST
jgi:hypothetical protein